MSDYPEIQRGTRWEQTQARQWKNLTDDVRAPANIQAGPGIILNRVGGHLNVGVIPPLLRLLTTRLPRPKGGTGAVEKFQTMNDRDREGDVMHDDWFYAERLSTGETDIKIAKPHKLQTTPWHLTTVSLPEFEVTVEYIYPRRFPPTNFSIRWAVRDDEPNIRAVQIIWPPYGNDPSILTPDDFIYAIQVGEETTGVDGVDWQDLNDSARVWSVFPAAFRAQS